MIVEQTEIVDSFGIPSVEEDFKTTAIKFKNQGGSPEEVDAYLSDFKDNKQKITHASQKDIDRWSNWEQFKRFVDELKKKKTKSQAKKEKKLEGATLVGEDKYWRVYRISSHDAACMYGSGTKWCITEPGGGHWENYSKGNDVFFFYISKRLPPSSKWYKIAMQVHANGDKTYWDAKDESHEGPEWPPIPVRSWRCTYGEEKVPFKLPQVSEAEIENARLALPSDDEKQKEEPF